MESLRPKVTLAIAPAVLYQTPDCSGMQKPLHRLHLYSERYGFDPMVEASGQESESSTGLSRTLSEDQQAYQSAKTESDVESTGPKKNSGESRGAFQEFWQHMGESGSASTEHRDASTCAAERAHFPRSRLNRIYRAGSDSRLDSRQESSESLGRYARHYETAASKQGPCCSALSVTV
ncbi:hypothetical protein BD777DRAFT_151775 [Yarrowia lipolytica]|nr:hypothetical protein BD777DRAFT_151775 [Yarrowia lipolytica]